MKLGSKEEDLMRKTELHVHSTFSDGVQTPEEIVHLAKEANIQVLSITDHDEIGAYKEALPLAEAARIELIPGIELNTDGEAGELHILGYLFDPEHPEMLQHISWRKAERKNWATKIVARLNELGYSITFQDVERYAPKDIIVRTHIASALCEKDYFTTTHEAYHGLLVKGKPAFIERGAFSAKDAIELIQACGGEAYLAHPGAYRFPIDEEKVLSYGIDGIEVYHSKHSETDVSYWKEFALKNQLLISGGSDSHGRHTRNAYAIGSVQLDEHSRKHWLEKVGAKR